MSIETAGGPGDGSDLEGGDGMVDDFEVGFELCVLDLLEEDFELVFDLLGFVEEVELVLFFGWEYAID